MPRSRCASVSGASPAASSLRIEQWKLGPGVLVVFRKSRLRGALWAQRDHENENKLRAALGCGGCGKARKSAAKV